MGNNNNSEILIAIWANLVSWIVGTFFPSLLPKLLPKIEQEEEESEDKDRNREGTSSNTKCISIGRPGGSEQLRCITLKRGIVTVGYNVYSDIPSSFTKTLFHSTGTGVTATTSNNNIPSTCVLLRNKAFSINYADCCIRWGLYESANQFVGWPIVPGFDVAGVIEKVSDSGEGGGGGEEEEFQVGNEVFGCTLFGAYSTNVLVPKKQLRKIPTGLTMEEAASLPAVSLTALYALCLAGHFPLNVNKMSNKSILIHSAAGGVGSMLVQMSKILGLSPIVGVVGRTNKVEAAKQLGCDFVIDKQQIQEQTNHPPLWSQAKQAIENEQHNYDGYGVIMDANGVTTLQESYNHLGSTGRLIVYGFHTNLPIGKSMLSPTEWLRMGSKMAKMPKFDPMDLTTSNKAVLGFNLSFFSNEVEMLSLLFDQVVKWLQGGQLKCPRVVEMDMDRVVEAHDLIQSGKSIGKIVVTTTLETSLIKRIGQKKQLQN